MRSEINGSRAPMAAGGFPQRPARRMGLSGRWSTTDRAVEDRRRQQMVRRSAAKFLALSAPVLLLVALLHLAVGLHPQTCMVLGVAGLYAAYNECIRISALQDSNTQLTAKVRTLLESRRAAGLKRLGQEVSGRLQSWPRPPYSYTATVLGRFNSERLEPLREREVDYRSLAIDAVEKLVEVVKAAEAAPSLTVSPASSSPAGSPAPPTVRWRQELEEIDELRPEGLGAGARGGASELRVWLLQRLMHEGPTPEADPELFQDLHSVLDIAETKVGERGFFCRLCLGYHLAGTRAGKVQLSCGRCLCGRCTVELVEGVLDGRVRVPVACPTGSCNAVLRPELVEGLVPAEDFERFQRMHSVKMSLDTSAPHNEGLAARLAQARGGTGQRPASGPLPTVSERPAGGSPFAEDSTSEPGTPLRERDARKRPTASASNSAAAHGLSPASPGSPADPSPLSFSHSASPRTSPELSLPAAVAAAADRAAAASLSRGKADSRSCWPLSPSAGGSTPATLVRHPPASPPRRGNGGVSISSLLGPLKLDGASAGAGPPKKRHDD